MTDKVKRTMLTPEQRVAKLEAELAAAKAKADARANKEQNMLLEKRSKLTGKVNVLLDSIEAIDAQLADLGVSVTAITERVEPIDEGIYT
jgi:uncharacterized protein YoxC